MTNRFSWDKFDDATIRTLAEAVDPRNYRPTHLLRETLASRVRYPTLEFVRKHKEAILHTSWLREHAGPIVESLINAGVGPMGVNHLGPIEYIRRTRAAKKFQTILSEAMLQFGQGNDYIFFRRFVELKPSKQPLDPREPHPYQKETWEKLTAEFAQARSTEVFHGLIVMPTGSGKTYTAARWLLEYVVSQGMKVLWIAHRHELLTQAGAEFQRLAGFAKPPADLLRIRVVSAVHCAASQIDPTQDHIIVTSIGSLARRPDIAYRLINNPEWFIVIDEAHHAPAKSYRYLISRARERRPFHLLGVTATPTRTIDLERPILTELFGGKTINEVKIRELIETCILARPYLKTIKTQVKVEQGLTPEDITHYTKFNDLSEQWLDRIANISERNTLIIQHYLEHRENCSKEKEEPKPVHCGQKLDNSYGPTLVFAINVPHAALLAEQFKKNGIKADYVASYRPDGTPGNPSEIIEQFRKGELEVLVNVQMMTEGVDVPGIKTVFLTRPTSSEILFRQMIGRALRGPKMKGTPNAYLVSFEDHWERFRDWENPFELVPDIIDTGLEAEVTPTPLQRSIIIDEALPWDLIRTVAELLRQTSINPKADIFEAIPHGWYVLERDEDDQGIRQIIAVYEHQRPCWEALIENLVKITPSQINPDDVPQTYDDFFADCDYPWPAKYDITLMVNHFAQGGESPTYNEFKEREQYDPYQVAQEILKQDMGEKDKMTLVEQRYTTKLVQAIYSTLRNYYLAINEAIYDLQHPGDSERNVRAIPIFEPRPDQQLAPGPTHNLEILMKEMLEQGRKLHNLSDSLPKIKIVWTKRLVKGWYGKAYFEQTDAYGNGKIRINRLLDSPDISADTIRFLLWHEYLHLYLKQGHTPTFRELERQWPGCIEADRVLDNLNERFGIQYW